MIIAHTTDLPETPESEPHFGVGQIVVHRRYGYRGVIVAFDPGCRASDGWYQGNKTQPKRDQPWYHVLVDGSDHTTYAAQDSLAVAYDDSPIDHPLIDHFFLAYSEARYIRNDRPWPSP